MWFSLTESFTVTSLPLLRKQCGPVKLSLCYLNSFLLVSVQAVSSTGLPCGELEKREWRRLFLAQNKLCKETACWCAKIFHCLLIQCPVVMPSAICAKTLPMIQYPVQFVQRRCLLIQCPVVCLLNELPCSCCLLLLWTALLKVHVECVCWFFTEISIFAPWRCCFNSMKAFLLLTSQCTCQVCSVVFDQQNASSCVFVIVIVCDVF